MKMTSRERIAIMGATFLAQQNFADEKKILARTTEKSSPEYIAMSKRNTSHALEDIKALRRIEKKMYG